MIEQLDSGLRRELMSESYLSTIQNEKIFRLNFSENFLKELARKVHEKKICGEILFRQGELLHSIYILRTGMVERIVEKRDLSNGSLTSKIEQEIPRGSVLGSFSFFSGLPSDEGIKSINVASFLEIRIEDFKQILMQYPKDHEIYLKIKDDLNVYGTSQNISNKCHFCKKYAHRMNKCPMINCVPNKRRIILRESKTEPQVREPFKRKRNEKQSSIANVYDIQETIIQYLIDVNPQDLEEEELHQIIDHIEEEEKNNDAISEM